MKKTCIYNRDIGNFTDESPWVRPNRPWLNGKENFKIPKTLNYPDVEGVHCLLKMSAEDFPNNLAFYFKPKEEKYTFLETSYNVDIVANSLVKEYGIKKGDGIACMAPNCSEFIFAAYGILESGGILIPINPLLKKKEVSHIVSNAEIIKVFFVGEEQYGTVKRSIKGLDIEEIIIISDRDNLDKRTFKEMLNENESKKPDVDIDIKEDLAAILYTGGTTGLPKGVMLTHSNIISNTLQFTYTGAHGSAEEGTDNYDQILKGFGKSTAITTNPLCHGMGFFILNSCISGAITLIIDRFDPERLLRLVDKYKVMSFTGIPAMYNFVMNNPYFEKFSGKSLRFAASGASPLAPKLAEKWENKTGLKVANAYGLTEATCTVTVPHVWTEIDPESISFPMIDTDAKVVEPPDYVTELPIGNAGELLIRGPQVMKGYWKNETATEGVLIKDDEGKIWLRTGDIAKMDERGFFYIVGRSKEQIKYKGYRILPAEVESSLYEHPAVLECGVIGIPDEIVGETIKAFIKLRPEFKDKITEQEIIDWSKEKMAGYKWPRKVEFVPFIPKTAVGKVLRRKLLENELKKMKNV
ncbi:MAG: AMP-binding protein [Candidatus Helarchaeota archaeon]